MCNESRREDPQIRRPPILLAAQVGEGRPREGAVSTSKQLLCQMILTAGHCLPSALFRTNARRTPALLSCWATSSVAVVTYSSVRRELPPDDGSGRRPYATALAAWNDSLAQSGGGPG